MVRKWLVLCAVVTGAVLALTGCGEGGVPEGYFVLDKITEGDVTVEDEDLEEYGLDDSYAVFDEDGDGYLVLLNRAYDFTYNKKQGTLDSDFGEIALSNDGKTVSLADGKVSMVFIKSKKDAPEKPGGSYTASNGGKKPGNDGEVDLDAIMGVDRGSMEEFWNSDWYGWWEVDGFMNEYDQFDGMKFSVLGHSTLDADGNGTIHIWDNGADVMDVVCSNNGYGLTEYGTMVAESGTMVTSPVEHADFTIDPGPGDPDTYEGYIYFNGRMEDENGDLLFTYDIHLVKWGIPWTDIPEDQRPNDYDWYQKQIDQGKSMPDKLPE